MDDVISNLPEEILSSIVSNLSIRDATRARVLSPRWRHISLSPSTPNLHLDIFTVLGVPLKDEHKQSENCDSRFVKAVYQILDSCKILPPVIDSFSLCYALRNQHASDIDSWIRVALGLQTKKLHLELGGSFTGRKGELYHFPTHLPTASHLKHLYLRGCIVTQTTLDSIFSGCINLESLRILRCRLPAFLSISSKQRRICLKELVVNACFLSSLEHMEISSLDVEAFEYKGCGGTYLHFVDTRVTVEARLWGLRTCFTFDQLAAELPQLPMLSILIDTHAMKPLHDKMTQFCHLKDLELLLSVYPDFDLLSLSFILDACPGLHKFCLGLSHESCRRYRLPERREIQRKCGYNELKQVEINSFINKCNALDLVLYLLHACTGLERMTIDFQKVWGLGIVRWRRTTRDYRLEAEKEQLQTVLSDVNSNAEILVL